MRKVFVAYDFASGGTLSTDLQTISSQAESDLEVTWPGGSRLESPGELWEQKVRPGIEGCDRLVAFGDLPNANVGFELGFALSRKKEVGIAYSRSNPHRWLKKSPFRGEYIQRLENVDEIEDFLCLGGWPESNHWVEGKGKAVLFLCPRKSGAAFRKFRDKSWILPDQESWNLRSLEKFFTGIGLVVWVISPHNDGENGRDGAENAALSILAGFAEGHPELELIVLRSEDAREVADVASHDFGFKTIEQFKNLLLLVNAGWEAPERSLRIHFRDWLPHLIETPAFANVDFGVEKKESLSLDRFDRVNDLRGLRKKPIPSRTRTAGFARVMAASVVFAFGISVLGILNYFGDDSGKIVFGEEIQAGVVVRLRAENFDSPREMKARVGEMGNLKIRIPDFEISEEFRDTDKAPKVFLEVVKPSNMVFEKYSWDENENYRSEYPWPIPHDRNRIGVRLITKGEWDQNKFEKAAEELSRQLADLSPNARAGLVEMLLEKSDLTLEALKKSVAEKKIPGLSLEDAVQTVDQGKIVGNGTSSVEKEPLSVKEKEALTAVVASTGALIRPSDRALKIRASGLVVGDHFVFTSPSVLPGGFAPERLPAILPPGDSLVFSLAEKIEDDQAPLVVQDVVAIHSEYVVLMVPTAGRRVRKNLEAYFPKDQVKKMLSKDFVFISPGERDEKCVAIGYPVATESTPLPFQKLLALSTKSGFQPRKRISVGRVYTSNPVWNTHTATTMNGSEGGPVAFIKENEVGIMGFNQGGTWLGDGYQLSATYNLGRTSPGNRGAVELVKNQIIGYAEQEISELPTVMKGEENIWKTYFTPEMRVYDLRKKLSELRTTAWAFHQSGNGPESYRLFRNGWIEFRNAAPGKKKHYFKSIESFEHLLKTDPHYYIAWLRLGEAYDKTLQRDKAYQTLKIGYELFKRHSNYSPIDKSNWEREVEASFLNTLFLVCKILGKHETEHGEISVHPPNQFEMEAEQYFFLLQNVCPYHPTLVGHGR